MKIEYLTMTRRTGLIDLLKEKGFEFGVEVGTDRGGYAADICKRYPEFELITMDPYLPYTEGDEIKTPEDMIKFREEAQKLLDNYPNCHFLPGQTSRQVAGELEDESIDFVFIDGDHTYNGVMADLLLWYPKLKSGGILSGHDYVESEKNNYGVIEAVNEFVEDNKIDPLYVLRKGTYVDCWMFYK